MHQISPAEIDAGYTSNQRFLASGLRPTLFAYPYGEYNLEVIERVRAAYFAAFGQNSGIAHGFDGFFSAALCL